MAEIKVAIEILSPIHLGSGQADVNIDSDVIHDEYGFPYFPAKRFKGLLYESALEVQEMLELSEMSFDSSIIEDIFHHYSSNKGKVSDMQLVVPNFYLFPQEEYQQFCQEWQYFQTAYGNLFRPYDVLETYTSLRYQTQLENGVAVAGSAARSLHNMRVLNSGLTFIGTLELINDTEKHLNFIALAIRNLHSAGLKRNRGFGRISCSILSVEGNLNENTLIENALSVGGI